MRTVESAALFAAVSIAAIAGAAAEPPKADAWVAAMREVHAKFTGKRGRLALFGDSITVSLAFWAPMSGEPQGMSPQLTEDWKVVKQHQRPECWRQWRGSEFGNEGGKTVEWAVENVDTWLKKLNPEVVVLMFGTNDLNSVGAEEYEGRLRQVIQRCLNNGTVVLLTTIPPKSGRVEGAAEFAKIARKLAAELNLPLIDYQEEILKRRPNDWDGALPQFKDTPGDEYNVSTLIARDGVHPSNPRDFSGYSERDLNHNGYALRNAMTTSCYADVIRQVLRPQR
jgi:lysophospholipase L1-like esterase